MWMMCRAIRTGRWKMALFILRRSAYGLSHRHCIRCGKIKGFNVHRHCYGCQLKNLTEALEDVEI